MSIISPNMPIGATVYVALGIPANARADLQIAIHQLKREVARFKSRKNKHITNHAVMTVSAARNTWFAEELTSQIEHLMHSEGLNFELATQMSATIATKRALAADHAAKAAQAEALIASHRTLISQLEHVIKHLEERAEELKGVFGLELCNALAHGEISCETVAAELDETLDEIEAAFNQ